MKLFFAAIIAFFSSICLLQTTYAQEIIAFWDFNDGFDEEDESAQIVHNASVGSGVLYQQRADTDGNGKGGNAYNNVLFGIDVPDGRAMAWDDVSKSGPNDAEFFITFSTLGLRNIMVSFDLRGNNDEGIESFDVKYDTNPLENTDFEGNTIRDFAGGNSTELDNNRPIVTSPDDFMRFNIDLSGVALANNQVTFALRIDDINENDALRIDNVLVAGTTIPEPSSISLLIVGCVTAMGRRRRG